MDNARWVGERSVRVSGLLVAVVAVAAPESVAEALGVRDAIVRRHVVRLDDRPVELVEAYYPRSLAAGTALAEQRRLPDPAPKLLGVQVHDVRERITARTASPDESALFRLGADSAVLVLTRVCSDVDAVPFEVTVATMVAADRHLDYHLRTG